MNTNSQAFQSAIGQITQEAFAILSTLSLSQSNTIRLTEPLAVTGPITGPVPPPRGLDALVSAKQIAAGLGGLVTQLQVHQKILAGLIAAAEAA